MVESSKYNPAKFLIYLFFFLIDLIDQCIENTALKPANWGKVGSYLLQEEIFTEKQAYVCSSPGTSEGIVFPK